MRKRPRIRAAPLTEPLFAVASPACADAYEVATKQSPAHEHSLDHKPSTTPSQPRTWKQPLHKSSLSSYQTSRSDRIVRNCDSDIQLLGDIYSS